MKKKKRWRKKEKDFRDKRVMRKNIGGNMAWRIWSCLAPSIRKASRKNPVGGEKERRPMKFRGNLTKKKKKKKKKKEKPGALKMLGKWKSDPSGGDDKLNDFLECSKWLEHCDDVDRGISPPPATPTTLCWPPCATPPIWHVTEWRWWWILGGSVGGVLGRLLIGCLVAR